jgi:hypothetical protein
MIVIYGWRKQSRPLARVLTHYCYVCQRDSDWHLWRESEWVTFFGVNTIPFLSKDALVCERCEDALPLPKARSRQLLRTPDAAQAAQLLEAHQLHGKTEVQRNFLQSMRQARERAP